MLRATTARYRTGRQVSLPEFAIDLLATYRLTTLVKDDKIAENLRHGVFKRFGPPDGSDSNKVSYLVTCPWCLSIYFGALAVGARAANRRYWSPIATSLALSATVGLLSEARARMHRDEADGE